MAQRNADAALARARISIDLDRGAAAEWNAPRIAHCSTIDDRTTVECIDADRKLASRWRQSGGAARFILPASSL
ncbi:hypothetical protein [Burkholderia sp. BE17]|uniref:hypothetical protein n=1 Tax=Burkholderia sp. BE17 TaxID=2656644 RepID=UPI00128B5785|nr:hypothetical protein [Burkholderia sp. BE17]MPV67095.1 hypothetical protein [Burkholderia sp. BE17]